MTPASLETPRLPAGKKKHSRRFWFVIIVVLAIAGFVVHGIVHRGDKELVHITTEKAVIKTITQLVSATGKVQPELEVKIQPEVSGEIVKLPFREGGAVKKGDLLVSIKPDNYQFQVDQTEAALAASKAEYVNSQAQLVKAEEDFRRNEDLYTRHLISDSDFTASKTALDVARSAVAASLANVHRNEGSLKQSQDQLEKTTIYSPIDGTVSSLSNEVGERVAAMGSYGVAEVMRVADLNNMEVRVNINENDIVNVKVGDCARISIDAFAGRSFTGEVKEIGSAAKVTGQGSQDEVTNFQVKIRILDREPALRPGMSANADIETETAENVVAVPIQSVAVRSREGAKTVDELAADREKKAGELKTDGGTAVLDEKQQRRNEREDREKLVRVVFVREEGKVRMVTVDTGIADNSHMQIKSGIKAGDEVVSGSFVAITRLLKDGSRVVVDQPAKEGRK